MKKNNNNPVIWLWEFSKKVVAILLTLYVLQNTYTCVTMILSDTYDALPTLITECNETFRVCIGGYLLKAGIENAIKITVNPRRKKVKKNDEGEENT